MSRSLEKFATLGVVVFIWALILPTALGAADVAPDGWRPLFAFLLVVAVGGAIAGAYLTGGKGRVPYVLWSAAGVLAIGALLTTFVPALNDPDSRSTAAPDSDSGVYPPSSSPSPTSTPAQTPSVDGPTSAPPTPSDSRPREADVTVGEATVLYGGDLRLSLSGAFSTFAWMGMFTRDQSCDSLSPDVGETLVMVDDAERFAYEMTLLTTRQRPESVRVEIRRRAPDEYEVGCP